MTEMARLFRNNIISDGFVKMNTEYELKFFLIDQSHVAGLKKLIKRLEGHRLHKEVSLVRRVFDLPDGKRGFARVRQEHDKTTMTVKTFSDGKFPSETEIVIPDMETGVAFLEEIGLSQTSYQESRRETWTMPGVHEIAFDTIPGLPPYVEVDCSSMKDLENSCRKLHLDMDTGFHGSFDKDFDRLYGIPRKAINDIPSLTFKTVRQQLIKLVSRNIDLFKKWSSPSR